MKLDIGCGPYKMQGFTGVDVQELPGVDVVHDLDTFPWPFEDASCEYIRAHHIMEHLSDNVKALDECYRILQPGEVLEIEVPTTDGWGAFSDPSHKSFWNADRLLYICPELDPEVYANTPFSCKFELVDLKHYDMRQNVIIMNVKLRKT